MDDESREDELIARFGLRPADAQLSEIRAFLTAETERGWDSDIAAMKVCCIQLFNAGDRDDILSIWRAKQTNFDAACSIDVQLLCGQGLAATKAYLAGHGSDDARQALAYLAECETAGDFDGFTPSAYSAWWRQYYFSEAAE